MPPLNKTLAVFITLLAMLTLSSEIGAQDYAPAEIIVKYKAGQTPDEIDTRVKDREVKSKSFTGKIQNSVENLRLSLSDSNTPEEQQQVMEQAADQLQVDDSSELTQADSDLHLITYESDSSAQSAAQEIAKLPTVEYAHPNYIIKAFETHPNDKFYPVQWNLQKIQAHKAWDISKGKTDIRIAIFDTGITDKHEDLDSNNVFRGKDFIDGDNEPKDQNGHGSHIAGIISSKTNNSTGISGVMWNTKLMIYRTLGDNGEGLLSNIIPALDQARKDGAHVVNMSLGGYYTCNQILGLQEAIDRAHQNNMVIIAAAGNDSKDSSGVTPASCNHVITVGATNNTDQRAEYSNFGTNVDLSAPGGGKSDQDANEKKYIAGISHDSETKYPLGAGTSQAAPHVAAAAGLLLSVKPDLTPDAIREILVSSADSINTDQPVGPRLNIYKALLQVTNPTDNQPTNTPPSTHLTDLDDDNDTDYKDLTIFINNFSNSGKGDFNSNGIVDLFDFSILLLNL